jgi:chromatin modification-related protein EAF6
VQTVEQELAELLRRKKEIDRHLSNLETQIYNYEGSYLEDTQQTGNIVRGLEGYFLSRSEKKKMPLKDSDRIFSRSSATFAKVNGVFSH